MYKYYIRFKQFLYFHFLQTQRAKGIKKQNVENISFFLLFFVYEGLCCFEFVLYLHPYPVFRMQIMKCSILSSILIDCRLVEIKTSFWAKNIILSRSSNIQIEYSILDLNVYFQKRLGHGKVKYSSKIPACRLAHRMQQWCIKRKEKDNGSQR